MAPAVKAAEAAGIPVVALNDGFDVWKSLGVQQYFGQDETYLAATAGERLTTEGAKNVLCIMHDRATSHSNPVAPV